jgi:hypothetical protein
MYLKVNHHQTIFKLSFKIIPNNSLYKIVNKEHLTLYTVTMQSVTQEHNMHAGTEHSVINVDRSEKSVIHIDWATRPTSMTEFSSTHMLYSCVTLVFFNSVHRIIIKQDLNII